MERGGILPEQAMFWYNMSSKSGKNEETVLYVSVVYRYAWRHLKVELGKKKEETTGTIELWEEVW